MVLYQQLSQIFSILGAFLLLIAYISISYANASPKSIFYNLINLLGSALLCYSSILLFNAGVLILNTCWVLISAWNMINSKFKIVEGDR